MSQSPPPPGPGTKRPKDSGIVANDPMTDEPIGRYYETYADGVAIRIAATSSANLDEDKITTIAKLCLAELKRQIADPPQGDPA
jgi:hypothetical protein